MNGFGGTRPWGRETILHMGGDYLCKRLEVDSGHRLSLQYHPHKVETLMVVEGKPVIRIGKEEREYKPGESADIPAGVLHRITAPHGKVVIFEASTPHMDDTVRVADDYGRVPE